MSFVILDYDSHCDETDLQVIKFFSEEYPYINYLKVQDSNQKVKNDE